TKAVHEIIREAIDNSPAGHRYQFVNHRQITDASQYTWNRPAHVMLIGGHIGGSSVLIGDR
ncbi:hypothetical protein HAX54_009654, partial [Datura stramonium]|nr:hypothetical protein [Datura stramonium]